MASYTLTAENPSQAAAVPQYNLTFRDVLPAGVTYAPGSTDPGWIGDPTIYVDPVDGHQTLIWDNVYDLQVGQSEALTFDVALDPATHPVGSKISNSGDVYANSDPRVVVKVNGTGTATGGFTESASSAPVVTSVSALKITKTEPSPEAELVRGVHNHASTYTLIVRNSASAPTQGVTVVDYLPAGLEFLRCGDTDNSSAVEYPGAPRLDAVVDLGTNCSTPASVSTVSNPPGRVPGVYTRVQWDVGTLPAGGGTTIQYLAGIPQRLNTMTFPDGAPTPESLGQSANLDNNTGASTRELGTESSLVNYVDTAGSYTGTVAPGTSKSVTGSAQKVVTAEDIALQKAVNPNTFKGNGIATYTLTLQVSQYTDATDIVIMDRIPSGMCPLSSTQNYAPDAAADCNPDASFAVTGATLSSVVANTDGSYDVTFAPLASAADGELTITYKTRMRSRYRSSGLPTVSGDNFENSVKLAGATVPNPRITTPDSGEVRVSDDSAVTLTSDSPTLDKRIQPDAAAYECSASPGDYINPESSPDADTTFAKGSRVCFLLRLDFSQTNFTRNPVLTDFLPGYLTYEAGSAVTSPGSTPATLSGTDPLRWDIGSAQGSSRYAEPNAFFEVRFSAIVTGASPAVTPDITANLAKFAWANSDGRVFGLRDKTDLKIAPVTPITIGKSAVRASAPGSALPANAIVVADEVLNYTVTLGHGGTAANGTDETLLGPDTWDVLPTGVTCARISSVSDAGVCTNPGDANHPAFTLRNSNSAIRWNLANSVTLAVGETKQLTYSLQVPNNPGVTTAYTNTAAVTSFETINNTGATNAHFPADNVDTTVPADRIDAPAAAAQFTVVTPSPVITKTNTTSIIEPGNNAASAVVGEIVRYQIDVTVPARTTVYRGIMTDPIPAGPEFLSYSPSRSLDGGATFASGLESGFSLTRNGANVVLGFPGIYVNSSNQDQRFW